METQGKACKYSLRIIWKNSPLQLKIKMRGIDKTLIFT
jgi:hypothetical protein